MTSKKYLLKRIVDIENQLEKTMYQGYDDEYYLSFPTKQPTLRGKVDAIMNHLDIKVVVNHGTKAKLEVVNKGKK